MIEVVERYTRAEIQANPEKLYVFGDNFERKGFGGQAAEARNETNALGIATKIDPGTMLLDEYYSEVVFREFLPKFMLLKMQLDTGGIVVWPKDGIGTGLAMLPVAAPKIYAKLVELQDWLGVTDAVSSYSAVQDEEEQPEESNSDGGSGEHQSS